MSLITEGILRVIFEGPLVSRAIPPQMAPVFLFQLLAPSFSNVIVYFESSLASFINLNFIFSLLTAIVLLVFFIQVEWDVCLRNLSTAQLLVNQLRRLCRALTSVLCASLICGEHSFNLFPLSGQYIHPLELDGLEQLARNCSCLYRENWQVASLLPFSSAYAIHSPYNCVWNTLTCDNTI